MRLSGKSGKQLIGQICINSIADRGHAHRDARSGGRSNCRVLPPGGTARSTVPEINCCGRRLFLCSPGLLYRSPRTGDWPVGKNLWRPLARSQFANLEPIIRPEASTIWVSGVSAGVRRDRGVLRELLGARLSHSRAETKMFASDLMVPPKHPSN